MSQSSILLSLQNTTPFVQPISVMNPNPSQVPYNGGAGNATQNSYTYDITAELSQAIAFGYRYVSVIYSVNGGAYQMSNINYGTISSAQDIVNALNSLGQSQFYVYSNVLGATTIGSFSISSNGNNYYYSAISTNPNLITNSFIGSNSYGTDGSIIYNSGFNPSTGVGTISRINTLNNFWINSVPNTTQGRFNYTGVSSANIVSSQLIGLGIFANVFSNTTKNVYLGLSSNIQNQIDFYVNNNIILSLIPSLIRTSINSQIGVSAPIPLQFFWSIYPITLSAGNNYILMNVSNNIILSGASMAFEIYDNTDSEIASATSYSGLNLLYSTHNYSGNMI